MDMLGTCQLRKEELTSTVMAVLGERHLLIPVNESVLLLHKMRI